MSETYYLVEVTEVCQRTFAVPVASVKDAKAAITLVDNAVKDGRIEVTFDNMLERTITLNTACSPTGIVKEDMALLFDRLTPEQ